MPFKTVRDTTLFLQEKGSGPMALFLHAFMTDHTLWLDQLAGLSNQRRCVAVDMRGFGRSDPIAVETLDMDEYSEDAASLIGNESADLVGFSIGGILALMVAAKYPEKARSVTLISASLTSEPPEEQKKYFEGNAHKAVYEGRHALFIQFNDYIFGPKGGDASLLARARYMAMFENTRTEMMVATFRTMQQSTDRRPLMAKVKAPTLIVRGERDILSLEAAEAQAKQFPNGRVATIPGAGRIVSIEQPAAFNAELSRFWASAK